MKFSVFIFCVWITSISSQRNPIEEDKKSIYYLKFRSVKCEIFDNSSVLTKFCFVKPISRSVSSLNLGFDVIKPLYSIIMQVIGYYRYGNVYREVMNTNLVNFCAVMNGLDNNLLMRVIFDSIKH